MKKKLVDCKQLCYTIIKFNPERMVILNINLLLLYNYIQDNISTVMYKMIYYIIQVKRIKYTYKIYKIFGKYVYL